MRTNHGSHLGILPDELDDRGMLRPSKAGVPTSRAIASGISTARSLTAIGIDASRSRERISVATLAQGIKIVTHRAPHHGRKGAADMRVLA